LKNVHQKKGGPIAKPTLWQKLTSFNNLWQAFKNAARGKRSKPAVAQFEFNLEENLLNLQTELCSGAYHPGCYHSFYVHDPKRRLISAAPFRDRVVHHALCAVTAPLFERSFIDQSYANRVGKGTHRALDQAQAYLRRYAYALPLDVRQFFPSIDHQIMLEKISRVIWDAPILQLCQRILHSGQGVLAAEYSQVYFPGDDLLAALRPRGLPIGNLTSQFWANVYLNPLDHFIKRTLHCPAYLRYVDDMILFGNDKSQLAAWRQAVIDFLASLRLTVHEASTQVRPCRTGLPFLGFQLFQDHRRLKRAKVIHARRRLYSRYALYRSGDLSRAKFQASIQGWVNHARYGDTWGLRRAILKGLVL